MAEEFYKNCQTSEDLGNVYGWQNIRKCNICCLSSVDLSVFHLDL